MRTGGRVGIAVVASAITLLTAVAPAGAASPVQVVTAGSTVGGSTVAGTTLATPSSAPTTVAVSAAPEASTTATVGDPVADRRIQRIVIALCAVALTVFVITLLFWRATRPVPRPLRGLRDMGSRAGRRRAATAASSSSSSSPPASAPVTSTLAPAEATASLPDDG